MARRIITAREQVELAAFWNPELRRTAMPAMYRGVGVTEPYELDLGQPGQWWSRRPETADEYSHLNDIDDDEYAEQFGQPIRYRMRADIPEDVLRRSTPDSYDPQNDYRLPEDYNPVVTGLEVDDGSGWRTHSSAERRATQSPAVVMRYIRNNNGLRQHAGPGDFDQAVEPWGRYMSEDSAPDSALQPGWERGSVTFANPLRLPHDDGGWKKALADQYGATGKGLSQALLDAGHDGVITHDKYGTGEIVDIRPKDQRGHRVHAADDGGDLVLYHGTLAKNIDGIRQKGLVSPPGVNGAGWPMLTTDYAQAARYTSGRPDSVVLEYHVPRNRLFENRHDSDVDPLLWPGDIHSAYDFPEAVGYGIKSPLTQDYLRRVHRL